MAASKSVRFGKKQRNFKGKINHHKLIYKEIMLKICLSEILNTFKSECQ